MTDKHTPVIHLRDFPRDKLQHGLNCVLEFQESGYPQCGYGVHSDEAFELIFCEYTKTRNITARYSEQRREQATNEE